MKKLVSILVLLVAAGLSMATPIEVGSGDSTTLVHIEWSNGFVADFEVSYDAGTGVNGVTLFDIIEANSSLTTDRTVYTFGTFIDGIAFMGNEDTGFGAGADDWWHFYTMQPGDAFWTSSQVGAGSVLAVDGEAHGWSYGHELPVPEPMTIAMLGLGGILLRRKSK